jgi:hypothetical protein
MTLSFEIPCEGKTRVEEVNRGREEKVVMNGASNGIVALNSIINLAVYKGLFPNFFFFV